MVAAGRVVLEVLQGFDRQGVGWIIVAVVVGQDDGVKRRGTLAQITEGDDEGGDRSLPRAKTMATLAAVAERGAVGRRSSTASVRSERRRSTAKLNVDALAGM